MRKHLGRQVSKTRSGCVPSLAPRKTSRSEVFFYVIKGLEAQGDSRYSNCIIEKVLKE